MASESFFKQKWHSLSESVQDQAWYQQGRSKWDELDTKTRMMIRTGFLLISVSVLAVASVAKYSETQKKRSIIEERQELVSKLQKSQDELRRLRDSSPLSQGNSEESWAAYFESKASAVGIAADTVKIEAEKQLPADKNNPDRPKETLVDASIKKINLRKLVKLVYQLENGGRPAKVKQIQIDTEPDESGYLNLNLTLLGYKK